MSSSIFLVHANNRLTPVDGLTVPNLEKYKTTLSHQISNARSKFESKSQATSALINFKKAELNYISSYLRILNLLNSIKDSCDHCPKGKNCFNDTYKDDYDYDKEDEILNKIETEMASFKKLELNLEVSKKSYLEYLHRNSDSVLFELGHDSDEAEGAVPNTDEKNNSKCFRDTYKFGDKLGRGVDDSVEDISESVETVTLQ